MADIDCLVVGAGVVGLAVARALALAGREVVVVEAAASFGTGTSSRNSEVVHAGIYYPVGSQKARLCVAGRKQLYAFCAEHGVPHRRCGKLIVATTDSQRGALEKLEAQARANGVADLVRLEAADVAHLEPAVRCVSALHSPSTGIVDSHQFMLAVLGDAEARGVAVAYLSPVREGRVTASSIEIDIGGAAPGRISARLVVNAAGHDAARIARSLDGFPAACIPRTYLCKGTYFRLATRSPFGRLIYPMPEAAGLGVHATLDLAGQARFGPDVEWTDTLDFSVDPARVAAFYPAIRHYWPALPDGVLVPDYAGIRPKLQAPGEPARDFMLQGPREHGVDGLVNLYGIESPGLTASLALADAVVAELERGA